MGHPSGLEQPLSPMLPVPFIGPCRGCTATSAFFFSLKHIAGCQEGIGGSFPTLGQGVTGCVQPMPSWGAWG